LLDMQMTKRSAGPCAIPCAGLFDFRSGFLNDNISPNKKGKIL